MLIKGYVNQLCGETRTDLRMGVPTHVTNLGGLSATLIETQRKVTINSIYRTDRDACELEDSLEAQPQRFAMLGTNADSYNVVVCVLRLISPKPPTSKPTVGGLIVSNMLPF
jgi:hypothetical protein